MQPDYKNWIPKGMIYGLSAGAAASLLASLASAAWARKNDCPLGRALSALFGLGALGLGKYAQWSVNVYKTFSYDGERQLSRQIVEGIADYVELPEGGLGLDVGCGSGALAIACAKRNPQASMLGLDRWGKEYASFNLPLCENNASAEGTLNVSFVSGDARALPFPDESFEAVTSNYVYHNIAGANKQALLKETLRVLKKGGTFAIHDLMSPRRYGDMQGFVRELQEQGYERVELIDTARGMFMSPEEARRLMLGSSILLLGKK